MLSAKVSLERQADENAGTKGRSRDMEPETVAQSASNPVVSLDLTDPEYELGSPSDEEFNNQNLNCKPICGKF
jgi:hypothetical protein